MKVKDFRGVPRGFVAAIYNGESRKNSELWEADKNGTNWRKIFSGPEETVGEPYFVDAPHGSTEHEGKTYYHAERGGNVLVYDNTSGAVTKGARLDSRYKWNVCTVKFRGEPVVAGDGPDTKPAIFSMLTGEKLVELPLNGLVAQMCTDDDGNLWCAVSDGEKGVVQVKKNLTIGKVVRCNSASVAYLPGLGIVWGSQTDGTIHTLDGKTIADLKCSKVNLLIADTRNSLHQVVLAAGSRPDTFAAIHPNGDKEIIARFEDESVQVSGEQFDAGIALWKDTDALWWRTRAGKFCEVGKAEKK